MILQEFLLMHDIFIHFMKEILYNRETIRGIRTESPQLNQDCLRSLN